MNLYNLIFFVKFSFGQMLVGSQRDEHGCVLDGGYEWCENTQTCIRPWETNCIDTIEINNDCRESCPYLPPCPRPYMPNINIDNCKVNIEKDNCGCTIGCPSYDCSNNNCHTDSDCHSNQFCRITAKQYPALNGRRLQTYECVDKVGINETCGGFTFPEYQNRCLDELECVNVMGPMIADVPGICKERCLINQIRDENGNCLTQGISIPTNCASWFDGCNTCSIDVNGNIEGCTMMYCFSHSTPQCNSFYRTDILNVNDICYQYCEDNSLPNINKINNCPLGTSCLANSNLIGYDNCDVRAMRCRQNN